MTHSTISPRRMYTRAGKFVQPNPVQDWALTAFRSPSVRDLLLVGGLGGAKTSTANQGLCEVMAYNAWVTGGQPLHYFIVASSFTQLHRVTLDTFRGVWNAMCGITGSTEEAFRSNPTVLRIDKQQNVYQLGIGAEIHLGTGENSAKALEGGEYTAGLCDEPMLCKEETQPRMRERLRENVDGTIRGLISAGTPRVGWSLAWMHNRFGRGLDNYQVTPDGRLRVSMPTRLNIANLRPGYIDDLKRMYSPRMMEAMLEGRFVIMSGAVYSDWGADSIVDEPHDPKKPIIVAWDPGFRHSAQVCHQPTNARFNGTPVVGEKGWVIFDEVIMADTKTADQAHALARRPWMKDRSHITIAHDPAGVAKQSTSGSSDMLEFAEVLAKYEVAVAFKSSRKKEDHSIEQRCERLRATVMDAEGVRRLLINGDVAAREYRPGEDGSATIGIYRGMLEQPFKRDTNIPDDGAQWKPWTHAPDAEGYFAVFVNPVREQLDMSWQEVANEGHIGGALGSGVGGMPDESWNEMEF